MAESDPLTLIGVDGEPLTTPSEERESLQEALTATRGELRVAERNAEFLAYHLLNAIADDEDAPLRDRLKLVKLARDVWKRDPLAGRGVNLLNDFVFGRGAGKPKCRDKKVQEKVDEAWDDPQNQRVLTSYKAQRRLGTDLSIQSNVFLLEFAEGDDGKVKLGRLQHDTVQDAVRDPDNRDRILYYVTREKRIEWDVDNDRPKVSGEAAKVRYYEEWSGLQEAQEEKGGDRGEKLPVIPKEKQGKGKVYHVSVNQTTEMIFGHPELHRVTRWFSALNELASARVDLRKAAAAFVMKRKVTGSRSTVTRIAEQSISKRGELGAEPGDQPHAPPKPGGILNENDSVSHEPFKLDVDSGGAAQDADMLLGQASAGLGWPKGYLGGEMGSLAGATSLELPTLKLVEGRQEVWESAFRWFIDRVIERAVETNQIGKKMDNKELREAREAEERRRQEEQLREEGQAAMIVLREAYARKWDVRAAIDVALEAARELRKEHVEERKRLLEAHEDQVQDEKNTERDLSYEFALPAPLKRTVLDFVTAISNIAKTFDPNGTNLELSRLLLGVCLSEGLELEDAAAAVERIFPEDYVDPALAAFQAQQQAGPGGPPAPPAADQQGSVGQDGERHQQGNDYGAPQQSPPAEKQSGPRQTIQEAALADLPDGVRLWARGREDRLNASLEGSVWATIERELSTNGSSNGSGG